MKRILLLSMALLMSIGVAWAQRTVTGRVTDAAGGGGLPGVAVKVKNTSQGTVTDIDGNYRIEVAANDAILVFSYVGYLEKEERVGSRTTINVSISENVEQLEAVVVTALGFKREERTVTYATQEVKSEDLNITQGVNIKDALAGKVAGVQIDGQAGSKLGQFGKIRIRGAISLTSDSDPLYIVDGVPVPDPNDIDMNNVESINILKGPNATSLYGQRAEAGVVVITTKRGGRQLSIEYVNGSTWDRVAYLPKYQNLYGRGYDGEDSFGIFDFAGGADGAPYPAEWQQFDGKRYIVWDNNYADESWGPRFDGGEYVPWYAFWEGSPYFGQTAKWEAQPNNIKNFYNTGVTLKNALTLSGGGDNFTGLISYTNQSQKGITPYTDMNKHFINTSFDFNASSKLSFSSNIRMTTSKIRGDYDDGYGNQTSGAFNSWFAREVNTDILRELKDLKTPDGYSVSWNWWGPDYYASEGGNYRKPAFWYNPYTFLEQYEQTRTNTNVAGNITATYKFNDKWEWISGASRTSSDYQYEFYFPFSLANSAAPDLYNPWINSFGRYARNMAENNFNSVLKYQNRFGEIDVTAFAGGNIRRDSYSMFSAQMDPGSLTGGLIIPDVYQFSNAGIRPTPETWDYEKQVNSLYGNISLGFRDMLYLDASVRQDWSSALPTNNNGYLYPGIGASFIFTEMLEKSPILSFGKVRAGWAQVGNDVDALRINPIYRGASQAFNGEYVLMYPQTTLIDPNIRPAKNTSVEAGFDLRFIQNRMGLSFTYYNETRKDEIIPVSISRASGYNSFLTNAGASSRRGIELALDADVFKSRDGFNWNILLNFARNRTTVDDLPVGLDAIDAPGGSSAYGFVSVIQERGSQWGQLRGTGFARDAQGNKILQSNGLYVTEQNQFFGSVLPDFTGGIVNRFGFKGLTVTAAIDYQKGGKFFSLTEQWGQYSGLLEETAALNDKGNNVRDAVADGGGVRVDGVNTNGEAVTTYVDAFAYFGQFYGNRLAEPFIHDASFIKLRDVNVSYDLSRFVKSNFIKGATVGVVGRNLALLAVSKDNRHRWDPSELSQTYGENGQLPGTRSYGVNVRLTF